MTIISLLLATYTSLAMNATDTVTLYFGGDMMQHGPQIKYAARAGGSYDYAECFAYVKEQVESADLAVCNLEVPLAGRPYAGYPQFSAPDEYAAAIRDAGFDIIMTANNHCMDKRAKGLTRTIDMLDSLGLRHFGTYKDSIRRAADYPLMVEVKNMRIAFLGYTYDTNGIPVNKPLVVNLIDLDKIKADIRAAKERRADVIIACMHWGVEYRTLPEQAERDLAQWMLSEGVDHIIGAHPHVIQPMELVCDTPAMMRDTTSFYENCCAKSDTVKHLVAYSLGNYISNQSPETVGRDFTDGGASVTLKLTKRGLADCAYTLHWVSRPQVSGNKNYRVYPADVDSTLLNATERKLMGDYLDKARELYDKYNKGVGERQR